MSYVQNILTGIPTCVQPLAPPTSRRAACRDLDQVLTSDSGAETRRQNKQDHRNDKDECPFKLSPSDPCVGSSGRLLNVPRVQTDGDSVQPAPSHGVCFGPGGSHGGWFHQSLIPEQLLEVDDMLLTVLSW